MNSLARDYVRSLVLLIEIVGLKHLQIIYGFSIFLSTAELHAVGFRAREHQLVVREKLKIARYSAAGGCECLRARHANRRDCFSSSFPFTKK